ncbi:MAG: SusD/RagB family nutrient-binding outer membrane lipoprotein [Flavobacteriaceae bacterium]|nr:SusD/RagB family nutrient-binding outer membrane lipoprotein [Flavobacteriaceae bacterium]MDG1328172.1 SusD/RagB family nutrient-binding outer membrane lipoprotein [Flavobacteriaceae bacterium]
MNKNKNYINLKLSLLIILFSMSCTNDFEEINTNEFIFNEASPEALFTGVVKNTLDLVGGTMNDQMFNTYASFYGGKGGQFNRYFYTEQALDQFWKRFYVNILKNNQDIIDSYSSDSNYSNRVTIAKIWKSYVYSILVSTFGPVPYQEALQGKNAAAYNSEELIYTDILAELKSAFENLDISGDTLAQDPIFNGDLTKWKKFANSLRLKIALRISEGFPALAEQHGSDAMANEGSLISSNDENASMKWGLEQENWSFNYSRYVFVEANDDVVPFMNLHFLLNLKTYKDPRLFKLVEPSNDPITITDVVFRSGSSTEQITVEYELPYFGRPLGGNAGVEGWNLNQNDNILNGLANRRFSRPKLDVFMAADMSYNIITYSEINFIKAEAQLKGWGGSKTGEEYYYDGIEASFQQYGATGFTDYKNTAGIQWGTTSVGDRGLFGVVTSGISNDPIDKITRQRWLASYNQGHDIWCMQKRTRTLPLIDQFAPDGATGLDYAPLPERLVYPPLSEGGLNNAAYQDAILNLGGNTLYNELQMNTSYDPIQWETLVPELNQDFGTHFYGDSEDDLIAEGIDYTII